MRRLRHRLLAVLLACAGCSRERQVASPIDVSTTPQRGGTLRILQFGDVDHLATTSAYNNASLSLNTLTSRTLLTYPPVADNAVKIQPIPDLARLIPTRENGGINADG